jgi:hypothetical protein
MKGGATSAILIQAAALTTEWIFLTKSLINLKMRVEGLVFL